MRAPGIYQRIKKNVIIHPELRIQISCVLTSITANCVELIDQILQLKKKYPGYINMMDSTLELMKSQNSKQVTDNCEFRLKAFALGPTGEQKGKCMMGDNADCDRCGCVVPFHMATLSSSRLMIKEQFKSWRSQGAPAG